MDLVEEARERIRSEVTYGYIPVGGFDPFLNWLNHKPAPYERLVSEPQVSACSRWTNVETTAVEHLPWIVRAQTCCVGRGSDIFSTMFP